MNFINLLIFHCLINHSDFITPSSSRIRRFVRICILSIILNFAAQRLHIFSIQLQNCFPPSSFVCPRNVPLCFCCIFSLFTYDSIIALCSISDNFSAYTYIWYILKIIFEYSGTNYDA